jgi:hypothetical protein
MTNSFWEHREQRVLKQGKLMLFKKIMKKVKAAH